jgi:hypothetical protein
VQNAGTTESEDDMPFDVMIETWDEQFNWSDLPDSDREKIEYARDQFNTMQFNPDSFLRIEGPNTLFDKQWSEIKSIRIGG